MPHACSKEIRFSQRTVRIFAVRNKEKRRNEHRRRRYIKKTRNMGNKMGNSTYTWMKTSYWLGCFFRGCTSLLKSALPRLSTAIADSLSSTNLTLLSSTENSIFRCCRSRFCWSRYCYFRYHVHSWTYHHKLPQLLALLRSEFPLLQFLCFFFSFEAWMVCSLRCYNKY